MAGPCARRRSSPGRSAERISQGTDAAQLRHALRTASSSGRRPSSALDEVRDDFGVGFGDELVALVLELVLQLEVVLDDAVVDDDDLAGAVAVRVRVFFGRPAVRGPARVADAVVAVDRGLAG